MVHKQHVYAFRELGGVLLHITSVRMGGVIGARNTLALVYFGVSHNTQWPHIQALYENRDAQEDKRGATEYTDLRYMRIRVDAKRI